MRVCLICESFVFIIIFSLIAQRSDLIYKSAVSITHEQNIICSKTQLDSIAHLLSANEKEEKHASNDEENF